MKAKKFTFLAIGLLAASISHAVVIQTSFVGNAGNANDSNGFGPVDYNYHIGTYAVTNAQYTVFLNAVAGVDTHGLYNANMGTEVHGGISRTGGGTVSDPFIYSVRTAASGHNSGASMGEMPVNYVSFWDAARFTNWLTTGDTETGVYVLDATGISNNTITRDATAWANGGVAIASENEWYKAAYYNPTSLTYSLYATGSDTAPTAMGPNITIANSANYDNAVGTVTPVGAYTMAASAYGTFDQAGNVWDWNDEILSTSGRGLRGGSFDTSAFFLVSENRINNFDPASEDMRVGFRVSSLAPIPEPSTYAAIFGMLTLGFALWRRTGRGNL